MVVCGVSPFRVNESERAACFFERVGKIGASPEPGEGGRMRQPGRLLGRILQLSRFCEPEFYCNQTRNVVRRSKGGN